MNTKISELEKKVAALEGLTQERQLAWDRLMDGWESVLLEFCETYGLKIPDALKGKESKL